MAALEEENARLKRHIANLEAELEEQSQNLQVAARYGKSLLEQNEDQRNYIDDLMKRQAAILEEKDQEICSLRSHLEVQQKTEKWQQEEITSLQARLQDIHKTTYSQVCEEKQVEIDRLRKQAETLSMDAEHQQAVEKELRTRISEMESLLQTHLDRTQIHSMSMCIESDSEEMANLQQELMSLKMDMTEVQAKNIELSGRLQQAQCERDTLTNRLAAANTELEELQEQIMTYIDHLEQSRKEASELRARLDSARVEGQTHSSKGNSLFSELEDRRLDVEKKLASMKVQHRQLKEKYDIEKQQNQKYKMQIAMALQSVGHRQDDGAVQRLQGQLSEAHAEIHALSEQIQKMEASKTDSVEHLAGLDQLSNVDDKNYADFLMNAIKTEREEAAKARSELQTKKLQYLDMSKQNVELVRQTQTLTAECDKLRGALLKMRLQNEELQLKYEPDKVKASGLKKRTVEKLDLGDNRLPAAGKLTLGSVATPGSAALQNSTTGRASSVFKIPSSTAVPSSSKSRTSAGASSGSHAAKTKPVGFVKVEPQDSVLDDTTMYDFDKENLSDSMMDSTFALLHGCKVSTSDSVKVVDADGGETVKTLTDAGNGQSKQGVPKKKEPKKIRNLKYEAGEMPQAECKQQ